MPPKHKGKASAKRDLINDFKTEDGLKRIESWARDGLSLEQIAHNIGIHRETLRRWMQKESGICDAIKRGTAPADFEVENALYKRATGYKVIERKKVKNPDGTLRTEITEKEVPPDATAIIFWLKNRKPEKWRDRNDARLEIVDSEKRKAVEDFLADAEETEDGGDPNN